MEKRLSNLKKLLKQNNLDAMLVSSLSNIIYLTDFSYFTDIERDAFILITKNNNYIFTNPLYSLAVKKNVKNYTLLEISMTNPFTKLFDEIVKKEKIKSLGIEENNITVAEYKRITKVIKKSIHFDLREIRIKKFPEEIKKIQKACALGDKAFTYICQQLKVGITEKELAIKLEIFIRQQGAELSFPTIAAFGRNAAVPHHKYGNKKLQKNNFVLLDFGVKYENYCSDITRTTFFGKANSEQKKVYQTVWTAQKLAIEYIKKYCHVQLDSASRKNKILKQVQDDNLLAANVDRAARDYILSQGYPSIPPALGHGIGLHVHEAPTLYPRSTEILEEGMVFSIEPGIYLPDKFGIRIEDLFTIQKGKLVQLTKTTSELIELKI